MVTSLRLTRSGTHGVNASPDTAKSYTRDRKNQSPKTGVLQVGNSQRWPRDQNFKIIDLTLFFPCVSPIEDSIDQNPEIPQFQNLLSLANFLSYSSLSNGSSHVRRTIFEFLIGSSP